MRPGERVALVSRNVPEYVEALFGCWWAGLVAVPVNAKLHPKELAYIACEQRGALGVRRRVMGRGDWRGHRRRAVARAGRRARKCRVRTHCVRSAPRAVPATCGDDDPAWLFYTSGTTGRPKGVVITHGNLRAMSQCFLTDVEAVAPGDAILHAAPLSHGSGLYILPHVLAGAVNVVPESGGFDPDEIVALLDAWDRASFFAAPTMVKRLVAAPALARARLDRLKSIVLRRRSDVRRRLQGGLPRAGPAARADLRSGRVADDDHRDGSRARSPTRSRATTTRAWARSASRRPAST